MPMIQMEIWVNWSERIIAYKWTKSSFKSRSLQKYAFLYYKLMIHDLVVPTKLASRMRNLEDFGIWWENYLSWFIWYFDLPSQFPKLILILYDKPLLFDPAVPNPTKPASRMRNFKAFLRVRFGKKDES